MVNTKVFLLIICVCIVYGKKRLVLHNDEDILTRFTALEAEISQLKHRQTQLEQENHILKTTHGGSTYTIWGRTSCPQNGTSLVYKGYAAGNHFNKPGGGVNTLCLPDNPTWNKYSQNEGLLTHVFGVELESTASQPLLGYNYYNQDIPCAVCQTDRPYNIMIPGRADCYPGWTQEYRGYLLSGHITHVSNTDFICLDENPEAIPHGGGNNDEHVMYFVASTCSSLSCPPYVDQRELSCVICSQ